MVHEKSKNRTVHQAQRWAVAPQCGAAEMVNKDNNKERKKNAIKGDLK